ncbi:hypothetical protein RFI_38261 [Reticulomyxa filosa]|uniref:Uncharacterized protein n=1 Tax=Reticulomyxa filosa TaxID=46433 RepID=X6LCW1_RETFI|nr:hypothetical protein RFI_38261 [Reticulomyxa filosa]|eukprot:ETN99220.1 hypothetical protein RFI_38261 [Reticulomyxa filosa]
MPAPVSSEQSDDLELIASNLQLRNSQKLSDNNPYQIDKSIDPFAPLQPSFFKKVSSDASLLRPAVVPIIEKKWETMTSEEKREYYLDKKTEFIEYLDETFEQRLELHCEEICDEPWKAYQRCLGIKNTNIGGQRLSTSRAALTQIYFCTSQYHEYFHCLDSARSEKASEELKEKDSKNFFFTQKKNYLRYFLIDLIFLRSNNLCKHCVL